MSTAFIVALFVIGIILMALEFFVIPGFGVSGVLGIAALISGIVLATDSVLEGILITGGTVVFLALLVYLSFRSPATNPLWRKLSLATKQTKQDGYVAPKTEYQEFINQTGIALSPLRPAGTADFSGRRLDVVTEGEFIKSGSNIKVIAVEGTRIIVRKEQEPVRSC